jgi:excinuclease ABC subunit C
MHFSIANQPVYPHIKLTSEPFPRALATRIVDDDGDEYFGAFLNRTSVRILIDFLNKTFRLRTCTIEIDGGFRVPCTQYYSKRCIAPCVANLCDHATYIEMVDLVRLFLRNDRELFLAAITKKIERAAEELDFETAAFYRDILQAVELFWANKRWQVWLDDTVDSFELEEAAGEIAVIIVSQRRQRTLGTMIYRFKVSADTNSTRAIGEVIKQFYRHHVPREIRVSDDFEGRAKVARGLFERFGRKVNILVTRDDARRVTTERALDRTREELDLESVTIKKTPAQIAAEIKRIFKLDSAPSRIEAFDVAHISATGFAAAVSVWQDGKDRPNDYRHWISDQPSELETLRAFVVRRISRTVPDLILVDGGRSQLNATLKALAEVGGPQPPVIAAVKPPGKHSSISHFLTACGTRIDFDKDVDAFRLLNRLRDEAHDLANSTHRTSRDMLHFYELAAILPSINERERQALMRELGSIKKITRLTPDQLESRLGRTKAPRAVSDLAKFRAGKAPEPQPLIVPIRYVETDGAAEDLRPIATR